MTLWKLLKYVYTAYFSSCQRCHYIKNVDVIAFVLSSWLRQGNNNANLQDWFYQIFASMTLSCFVLYSNYIVEVPTLRLFVAVVCYLTATITHSHLSASQCNNESVCMTSVGHMLHHTLVIWLCSKLDGGLNCSLSSLSTPSLSQPVKFPGWIVHPHACKYFVVLWQYCFQYCAFRWKPSALIWPFVVDWAQITN